MVFSLFHFGGRISDDAVCDFPAFSELLFTVRVCQILLDIGSCDAGCRPR